MDNIPPWFASLDIDPKTPLSGIDIARVLMSYCDHRINENNLEERSHTNEKVKVVISKLGTMSDTFTSHIKSHETMLNDLSVKINTFGLYFEHLMNNLKSGLHQVFFSIGSDIRQVRSYFLPRNFSDQTPKSTSTSSNHTELNHVPHTQPQPVPDSSHPPAPKENSDDQVYLLNSQDDSPEHPTEKDLIPQVDGADDTDDVVALLDHTGTSHQTNIRKANFKLNEAKQIAGICKDAVKNNFDIISNDQNKNINITCNSGFYDQVAKPALCSLIEGSLPQVLGIPIICEKVTKNLDNRGKEFNRTIFFKLGHRSPNYLGKVTLHTHHSTRLVQVQGGSLMPDKSTSASWFVRNVLYGKMQAFAQAKKHDISAFNDAISKMSSTSSNQANLNTFCGFCLLSFDQRSKPVYCMKCVKWYHKTNCQKSHKCQTSFPDPPQAARSEHSSLSSPSSTTSSVLFLPNSMGQTISPPPTTPSSLSIIHVPITTLARTSSSCSTTSTSAFPTAPITTANVLATVPPPPNLSLTLNPNAQQFSAQPANQPLPKKTKTRQAPPNFSPEKAEIESLKMELSFARTKIVELDTKNAENEKTISIYSQKLKILEDKMKKDFHQKYSLKPDSPCSPQIPTDDPWSKDCSCQIRSKIKKNTVDILRVEKKIDKALESIMVKLDMINDHNNIPAMRLQPSSLHEPNNATTSSQALPSSSTSFLFSPEPSSNMSYEQQNQAQHLTTAQEPLLNECEDFEFNESDASYSELN